MYKFIKNTNKIFGRKILFIVLGLFAVTIIGATVTSSPNNSSSNISLKTNPAVLGANIKNTVIPSITNVIISESLTPTKSMMSTSKITSTIINKTSIATTSSITQTIVVTTVAPTTQSSVQLSGQILKSAGAVDAGQIATETISTLSQTNCSIQVTYSSGLSKAQGLTPKTSGSDGVLSWSWMVGTRTKPGVWPINISCTHDNQSIEINDTVSVN